MWSTYSEVTVTLLLICGLLITGPGLVSSEELSCSEMIEMLVVGTRVVRGKNWMWNNQDGEPGSQGTITGNGTNEGWYLVKWDAAEENSYRMGDEGKCDLKIVQNATSPSVVSSDEEPSCSEMAAMMKVGTRVVRGKDWEYGDQDGKAGTRGTVNGSSAFEDWFRVQWDGGESYGYRMGADGKCDLKIVNETTSPSVVTSEEPSCSEMAAIMQVGTRVVRGKDWEYGDQDGKAGTRGTATGYKSSETQLFSVHWDGGKMYGYRMGKDGKCDLKIVNETTSPSVEPSEEPSCSEMSAMMKVGTRVVRGKDWEYGDQDGGPGTQGTVTANSPTTGWYRVEWDGGEVNSYRMGGDGKCDLKIVQNATSPSVVSSEEPSCSEMSAMMKVGTRVVRGKDWKWGDQDGLPGTQGTVEVNQDGDGWFRVRWDSGLEYNYRMGTEGKCDLKIVGKTESPSVVSSEEPSCSEMAKMMEIGTKVVRGKDWRWEDQDGKPGTQGTVINPSVYDDWVQVRWEGGDTFNYRMGSGSKCDLKIVQGNPSSGVSSTTEGTGIQGSTTALSPGSSTSELMTRSAAAETDRDLLSLTLPAGVVEEVGRLTVERARVLLEAARSTGQAEASRAQQALLAVETARVALEAARHAAKAEESWAINAAEELEFEREHRKQIGRKLEEQDLTVNEIMN